MFGRKKLRRNMVLRRSRKFRRSLGNQKVGERKLDTNEEEC
jgi:hypothetical protein